MPCRERIRATHPFSQATINVATEWQQFALTSATAESSAASTGITALISYVTNVAMAGKVKSDAQADAAEARVLTSVGNALTATAAEATAATTAAKAIAGAETIAAIAGALAGQLWVQVTAAAEQTFANASIDAALTASNDAVDAVHTYVVVSIGVNLIASTAATGFALLRAHSAINAMTTAQKEAINAASTATLANLAADLIGRNASEALDDPIAIANATNNAAQAVKSAWQNVNNLQARAASTFAGMGPGGFAMTFAGFTGWFDGGWFSWPTFFSATGTTFTSGEAYDSLLGATHSMRDTMSFGYSNFTDSGPLYGNAQAYLNGQDVGFYWGVSNYIAIAGYGGWRLIVGPAAVNPNSSNYFGQFDSSRYPKPPAWNPAWTWGPPSTGDGTWRWFDPAGGEWRRHFVDSWHTIEHWDFNPWTSWNTPWQNIP